MTTPSLGKPRKSLGYRIIHRHSGDRTAFTVVTSMRLRSATLLGAEGLRPHSRGLRARPLRNRSAAFICGGTIMMHRSSRPTGREIADPAGGESDEPQVSDHSDSHDCRHVGGQDRGLGARARYRNGTRDWTRQPGRLRRYRRLKFVIIGIGARGSVACGDRIVPEEGGAGFREPPRSPDISRPIHNAGNRIRSDTDIGHHLGAGGRCIGR